MNFGSLMISGAALAISVLSVYFAIKSWRESHRPIVTAHVATSPGSNVSAGLNLVVSNSGNRPAKNVALSVDEAVLEVAMLPTIDPAVKRFISQIFTARGVIPVLQNGKAVSNGFGLLGRGDNQTDWNRLARFSISISYEDLDGRKYKHTVPILIADGRGFAGSWHSGGSE